MTIPRHRPQGRPATAGESGAGEPCEPGARQPGPVTYDDAARRYGPGTIAARERYDELSMRDHLARAYARPRATGEYNAARHGTGDTEPLTAAEHLELLATAEYLARAYKPSFETDNALRAGASWAQVADALGADEAAAGGLPGLGGRSARHAHLDSRPAWHEPRRACRGPANSGSRGNGVLDSVSPGSASPYSSEVQQTCTRYGGNNADSPHRRGQGL